MEQKHNTITSLEEDLAQQRKVSDSGRCMAHLSAAQMVTDRAFLYRGTTSRGRAQRLEPVQQILEGPASTTFQQLGFEKKLDSFKIKHISS